MEDTAGSPNMPKPVENKADGYNDFLANAHAPRVE
jgi:hypothetical protein